MRSRARTGWTSPARRRPPMPLAAAEETDLAVDRRPASAACGRRCWPRNATRPATWWCSRAGTIGWAASGRNGGFCSASLTHGFDNGLEPLPRRDRRPWSSSAGPTSTRSRRRSSGTASTATSTRTGELIVATAAVAGPRPARRTPRQARGLRRPLRGARPRPRCGPRSTRPPTWAGSGTATAARWSTRPGWSGACARPAWRSACASTSTRRCGGSSPSTARPAAAHARTGAVDGRPGRAGHRRPDRLLRRLRALRRAGLRLRADDRAAVGARSWRRSAGANRQGLGDAANQFHYYRLTADNRILWGGYDAVYYRGGRITPARDQRDATFLAAGPRTSPRPSRSWHGVRFTHRWGGVIDTCSRFSAFFGTGHGGRLAYAAGYTGLGRGRDPLRRQRDARPARRRGAPS